MILYYNLKKWSMIVKIMIHDCVVLLSSLVVLEYPFSFSMNLTLPILFCMRDWRFGELGSTDQHA